MHCPQCNGELSIREAITILNGTGYKRKAWVRSRADGAVAFVDAALVNPLEVEILDGFPGTPSFLRPAGET